MICTFLTPRNLTKALTLILTVSFPATLAAEPDSAVIPADARAVVLFKKGELEFRGYQGDSTRLTVHTRIQILKEGGKSLSEIEIPHGRVLRLIELEGRTILPDGREIPLDKNAIFNERRSRAGRKFLTKAAFPAVEVGSMIDFTYVLEWDAVYQLEPWLFHDRLPTLYSEIVYLRPRRLALRPWGREAVEKIQAKPRQTTQYGTRMLFYAENLRGIPEEPHSVPFNDLSTHVILFPRSFYAFGSMLPITEDWATVCRAFADEYAKTRRHGGRARKLAEELASGLVNPRERAERLYRYVRDEIRTSWASILPATESSNKILDRGVGNAAEKVLLLQTMLDAAEIDSELVWARARSSGWVDLTVPNPLWFETALVRLEIDGEAIYLDPADERLAFGRLGPDHQGTRALIHKRRKPQLVELPESEFTESRQSAEVELTLDAEGRLAGSGEWLLTGHSAWLELDRDGDHRAVSEAWSERLAAAFEGFEIGGVEVEEDVDAARIHVSWTLEQEEGDVLGDEASLLPSRPLGPRRQPFSLAHEDRKTPVRFDFPRREEVRLEVSWPEKWAIEVMPDKGAFANEFGALAVGVTVDEAARRVTFLRRFDLGERDVPWEQYPEIKQLFELVEKSDAQDLVFFLR